MSLRDKFAFEKEPIYLMDGNAFIFRGFYANSKMSRSDSFPTGAMYIVGRILMKLFREENPKYFLFVLDGHGKNFRHEAFPAYKAQRPPVPEDLLIQFDPIKKMIAHLGMRVETSVNCEADDCIASLAKRYSKERPVVIVGTDKDLRQCLNKNVIMWDPASKDEKIVTAESFHEDTGLFPNQWADIQALIGDSADNIPGIRGIGEKTAMKLFLDFPNLESIRDHYEDLPPTVKKKMEGNLDEMFLYRKLTTLDTTQCLNLSLDDMSIKEVDGAHSLAFFKEFELNSLAKDFGELTRKNLIHLTHDLANTLANEQHSATLSQTTSTTNKAENTESYANSENKAGTVNNIPATQEKTPSHLARFREKEAPESLPESLIDRSVEDPTENKSNTDNKRTQKTVSEQSNNTFKEESSNKEELNKEPSHIELFNEETINPEPLVEIYHVQNLPSCFGKILGIYFDIPTTKATANTLPQLHSAIHIAIMDAPETLQNMPLFQKKREQLMAQLATQEKQSPHNNPAETIKSKTASTQNINSENSLETVTTATHVTTTQDLQTQPPQTQELQAKSIKSKKKNTQQSLLGLVQSAQTHTSQSSKSVAQIDTHAGVASVHITKNNASTLSAKEESEKLRANKLSCAQNNMHDIIFKGDFEDLLPYMQSALQIVLCDVKKSMHVFQELAEEFKNTVSESQKLHPHFFDLSIGAWLLSPDEKDFSFNTLVRQYTLKRAKAQESAYTLQKEETQPENNTQEAPQSNYNTAYEYKQFSSIHKANTMLSLYSQMLEEMTTRSLLDLFYEMEMPLVPVLYNIEKEGIQVNVGALFTFLEDVRVDLDRLTKEIYAIAGGEFNIRSAQQIGEVLFKKLSLPMTKSTKGGQASTSQEVLEKLSGSHPIIDALQEFRRLEKLRSTYLEPLPRMTGNDGRIHTTLNQCSTATGRLSSSNPNLQNIPVRGDLGKRMRSCFTAKPEYSLVSADYSQVELRVLAHCSGDETLRQAFLNNEDIHARTAALLYSVELENVTPDMRRHAKTINFGLLYGMGSRKLSQDLHISTQEAKRFIEVYFSRFHRIKAFYDEVEEFAREHAQVTTLAGRQRALPNILSIRGQEKALAERQAVNTMIQGSAADIIKLAMLAVDRDSLLKNLGAKLLLQIHDELILEVPSQNAQRAGKRMAEIMMNIAPGGKHLSVPLLVDYGVGENWEGAH